jgi:hypothetical protein
MKSLKVALGILMACGALLLVLGVLIWTGDWDGLIPVHVALGVILVCALWFVCWMAARAGVPTATVAFAAGWGVLVVVLGLGQEELVPGDLHWTIQVLHLSISMGAIWWGRRLLSLMRRAAEPQRVLIASPASR